MQNFYCDHRNLNSVSQLLEEWGSYAVSHADRTPAVYKKIGHSAYLVTKWIILTRQHQSNGLTCLMHFDSDRKSDLYNNETNLNT
jgi:hypothetical protein